MQPTSTNENLKEKLRRSKITNEAQFLPSKQNERETQAPSEDQASNKLVIKNINQPKNIDLNLRNNFSKNFLQVLVKSNQIDYSQNSKSSLESLISKDSSNENLNKIKNEHIDNSPDFFITKYDFKNIFGICTFLQFGIFLVLSVLIFNNYCICNFLKNEVYSLKLENQRLSDLLNAYQTSNVPIEKNRNIFEYSINKVNLLNTVLNSSISDFFHYACTPLISEVHVWK